LRRLCASSFGLAGARTGTAEKWLYAAASAPEFPPVAWSVP